MQSVLVAMLSGCDRQFPPCEFRSTVMFRFTAMVIYEVFVGFPATVALDLSQKRRVHTFLIYTQA